MSDQPTRDEREPGPPDDDSSQARRSALARVFISPDERRLRAGWRLLLQTVLLLVLTLAGLGLVTVLLAALPITITFAATGGAGVATLALVQLVTITASVYLARRFLDRRSFRSLGLWLDSRAPRDLAFGILVAGVMMGLIYLVESLLGWLRFESFAWESLPASTVALGALGAFVVFVFVGWQEELYTRGYWLQNVADGLSLTWGVGISSLAFALLHLANPNVSPLAVAGLFLAGVYLAYGYVLTRQLWLPIGVHIGWNFFEGTVFGFPVSGTESLHLIRHTVSGPELWTGGAFGPEAGLVLLPALAVGTALIYLYARRFTASEAPC